jgi:hypothetical protein
MEEPFVTHSRMDLALRTLACDILGEVGLGVPIRRATGDVPTIPLPTGDEIVSDGHGNFDIWRDMQPVQMNAPRYELARLLVEALNYSSERAV